MSKHLFIDGILKAATLNLSNKQQNKNKNKKIKRKEERKALIVLVFMRSRIFSSSMMRIKRTTEQLLSDQLECALFLYI
jgi:hypothetical protein